MPEIGRHFGGRDHTTVSHACKAVERRLSDPDENERLTRLADSLVGGADPAPSGQALADWVLQELDELQRDLERLQDRMARFSLVLASSAGVRSSVAVPALPAGSTPAPVPDAPATEETEPPPWQCRTPDCRATRQPGRDRCAACITGKASAA